MDGRKVYFLLPFFVAFAIFAGGMLYADVDVVTEGGKVSKVSTVDLAALKAELKREIKAELAAERVAAPPAPPAPEISESAISSAVSKALDDNGLLGGLFKGVTAGGFIDVNYMYNLRNHGEGAFTDRDQVQQRENTNGTMNFVGENEEDTFVLENFALFLDKEATDEHPIGWQMHTYWGEKAKRITFSGPGPNGFGRAAGGGTSDVDRDDIFTLATANITWNVPIAGRTVPVTVGKMYTWIGYELVENIGNPNYSHGTVYNNAIPFTHTGMSIDVSEFLPSDKHSLTFYYVNGWDSFMDNNESKSWGLYHTWQINDDLFFSLATIHGPEGWGKRGPTGNGDTTMMYDIVLTYALPQVEKLSLGFNWDHGYSEETDLSGVQDANSGAHWWAAVGYAMYDYTDNQQGAFRYEYFDDDDGAKFFGHSMWTATYTHNITIQENLLLRPEVRYNKYNVSDSQMDNLGMGLAPGDKGNTANDEFIIGIGAEYVF
jgi:hypothetical protein